MGRAILFIIAMALVTGRLCTPVMEPVTFNDLLAATNGCPTEGWAGDAEFARVEIDSRKVRAGDLFWAIRGEHHDGHDFVEEALQNGAAGCVVHRKMTSTINQPVVVVEETLQALWEFASWYRCQQDALIVGVTGSFGKTTTREMIHAVLSEQFSGIRSPRNFNNHIGLPLSLLSIESHHEFAILEKGASRVGEIRDLAAISKPEVGVITGIGTAHFKEFGSDQAIIQAKGELLESLSESGFAVLAGDDPNVREMGSLADCPVIFVGEGANNDIQATGIVVENQRIEFSVSGHRYELNAAGRHHVRAALFAIAVGRQIGMKDEKIAKGLRKFISAPGRCQVETIGDWTVINDTYNANPASVQAACLVLNEWVGANRKLLVLGDMLELGSRSVESHYEAGRIAAESGIDHLITFGSESNQIIRGALEAGMSGHRMAACEDFDAVLTVLDCWLGTGDVVLVKGSRSMRMERVVEWLRGQHEINEQENTVCGSMRACA